MVWLGNRYWARDRSTDDVSPISAHSEPCLSEEMTRVPVTVEVGIAILAEHPSSR